MNWLDGPFNGMCVCSGINVRLFGSRGLCVCASDSSSPHAGLSMTSDVKYRIFLYTLYVEMIQFFLHVITFDTA